MRMGMRESGLVLRRGGDGDICINKVQRDVNELEAGDGGQRDVMGRCLRVGDNT